MKVIIFVILLFCFENFLFARECALESLNENEKGELYQNIKSRLEAEFNDFFIKNKIQLEQSEIIFKIENIRDSNFLEPSNYRVDIFFTGKTKRSILSNRPVEKYFEDKRNFSAYFINFFQEVGRDSEGIPYANYCNILLEGGLIQIYNTTFDNFLIGSFYPQGGLFARFENPLNQ